MSEFVDVCVLSDENFIVEILRHNNLGEWMSWSHSAWELALIYVLLSASG